MAHDTPRRLKFSIKRPPKPLVETQRNPSPVAQRPPAPAPPPPPKK
jgi:hypothetical protein